MLKAIKIRIYPNQEQQSYINKMLGTCRFVYNNCLSYKISKYNENKKSISFADTSKHLTLIKNEYEWIKESHSKVVQQTLINLDIAYKSFFKNGNGFPKFKSKKDNNQSCRFPVDAISGIKGNRINIIKALKDIHYKCSKIDEICLNKNQKKIKSATLTKNKSGKYHLSILIDRENNKKLTDTNKVIGIDVGIKTFIVGSDGINFDNIKIKRNNEDKLKRLHQLHSRRENNSKNKEKSRIKLARCYEKLNNKKEYYLHSITNKLLSENQVIVMEDLNVSGMLKNHCLAKSIQELSLYRFKEMLKYKANWYSRDIIEIDRWFPSSKLCSNCGYKKDDLTLNDRNWICPKCGSNHDRDFNAANNIEKEGRRILKIGLSSPKLTPLKTRTLVQS
jgi:putative transposase